jgi:hypothetical protein
MSLIGFLAIMFRERKPKLKVDKRVKVTLNLEKLRGRIPSKGDSVVSEGDVHNWLMRIGLTPTAKPEVWKGSEEGIARLPKSAVVKTERLA